MYPTSQKLDSRESLSHESVLVSASLALICQFKNSKSSEDSFFLYLIVIHMNEADTFQALRGFSEAWHLEDMIFHVSRQMTFHSRSPRMFNVISLLG